jgi:hypothetical protein
VVTLMNMQIRRYTWLIVVAALLLLVCVLRCIRKSERANDTPTAFSLDPVPYTSALEATPVGSTPTVSEFEQAVPTTQQWPECSLPLYPIKVPVSRRAVSATSAEIVYETHWVQRVNESDRETFVARAKLWTPECRMQAMKKACTPHCINSDDYVSIIEATTDLSEGKALLNSAIEINDAELKHARAILIDTKRFAAYAKTVVPHSTSTVGGRACLKRMKRDHDRVDTIRQTADKRFARLVVAAVLVHATGCVTCSEDVGRERECKWMHEELAKGDQLLRDAEKELVEMRKLMTKK